MVRIFRRIVIIGGNLEAKTMERSAHSVGEVTNIGKNRMEVVYVAAIDVEAVEEESDGHDGNEQNQIPNYTWMQNEEH